MIMNNIHNNKDSIITNISNHQTSQDNIQHDSIQSSLNTSIDVFCTYLLSYQKSLDQINNHHLGSFKNHYKYNYDLIKPYFNNDFSINNLVNGLYELFLKYDLKSINQNSLSIIKSILSNRFAQKLTDNIKRNFLENIVLIASNYYNQADINSQIDWNKQTHTETPNTNELLNMMLDLNNSYSDNQPDHHNNSFAQNQNNDIQSSNSFNIISQTQEI